MIEGFCSQGHRYLLIDDQVFNRQGGAAKMFCHVEGCVGAPKVQQRPVLAGRWQGVA